MGDPMTTSSQVVVVTVAPVVKAVVADLASNAIVSWKSEELNVMFPKSRSKRTKLTKMSLPIRMMLPMQPTLEELEMNLAGSIASVQINTLGCSARH
jgi:hypothetical protein